MTNAATQLKNQFKVNNYSKITIISFEASILLLGICSLYLLSQARVYLPWTPVPITGQSLGVLTLAASLGLKRGLASVTGYIALGAIGLPVFAGPSSGLTYLLGSTSGYLFGFIAAAATIGYLVDHTQYFKKHRSSLLLFAIGHMIIFFFGALILSQFIGWSAVWHQGVAPFLPGAILKTIVASAAVPKLYQLLQK